MNYYQKNKEQKTRVCISVSKKLGIAVVRNKIKRRVKNIIDSNKNTIQKGNNVIMNRQISIPDGAEQWLINLIELRNRTDMTFKQIAEKENLSEKSVSNVIFGKSKNPGVDLVRRILCIVLHLLWYLPLLWS